MRDVLAVVFAYVALIAGPGGVSQRIFEENRRLARLRFDFRDKPQPMQLAEALATSMQTHEDRWRQNPVLWLSKHFCMVLVSTAAKICQAILIASVMAHCRVSWQPGI